ncbi:dihydroxyacetone kinase subunit DhaL [Marinilactibacillus sp. Marseille-P9653]|uniref:dihydroxyacetone kinase subunit DhaL n=1 Tax=Marinilactibacillus sp. Marseille-P9653 TaxID=2866583 RepID=UPI001CE41EB0|nr:dihydroxyacetone kinase subunit DhaL [Marinilactibacillus sp. Marseille-P9653]
MVELTTLKKWIELFAQEVTENKETLNKLDSDIGDGDHGSNMVRGVTAVKEKIDGSEYDNLTDFFKDVGMTLVSKVGGASGPLYGSAFISMAKVAKDSDDLAELIEAGLEGIQKRGKAEPGEKTMIDEWAPVLEAIKGDALTSEVIQESLQKTKDMKATKGRASYLGDRSVGHLDPGAQSSAYLFETLLKAGVVNG